MPWVESRSPAFRVRHAAAHAEEAGRLLEALERTRSRLARHFPRALPEIDVVMHESRASLLAARPHLALGWLSAGPAARRYLAGCAGAREVHVLGARPLRERASAVPGSLEMLELSAPSLYARRVVMANNRELQGAAPPLRSVLVLRWAWLVEGTARWFAGQTAYARPAIVRRLREGRPPDFPPALRDAPLLGGTVIDLLAREHGEGAAARLARRLHTGGAQPALTRAFGGRPLSHTEAAWRSHLARLAGLS